MTNAILWFWKIFWKRWKLLLFTVAISFFLVQLGYMSILSFDTKQRNSTSFSHYRQHAAINKVCTGFFMDVLN